MYPREVAIDRQGLVYVTDHDNGRIQVYTPEGQFLSQFGTKGSSPGQLSEPVGIFINNKLLYITEEGNSRISIFTTDGQFVHSFGGQGSSVDKFNAPNGITFDNKGYMYVCDREKGTLLMY